MTGPFGDEPLTVLRRPALVTGSMDLDGVVATARTASRGPVLLVSRCAPTAAFSRRDTLRPGYGDAVRAAQRAGFEAVIRPVGGHLAAYDAGALVLHLWGPHSDPRRDVRQRFVIVANVMAEAFREIGIPDLRVGPVPGEYCDGEWSVNVGGCSKLVGAGQRLFRGGFLFCAVAMVGPCEEVRELLTDAYARLGLPLDPATVASADRWVPGIDPRDVGEVVSARLVAAVGASAVCESTPAAVSGATAQDAHDLDGAGPVRLDEPGPAVMSIMRERRQDRFLATSRADLNRS